MHYKKNFKMTYLLHVSAKILILIWAFGFFLFGLGVFIHLFLLLAVISLVSRYFISYKSTNRNGKIKQIKLLKGNH